MTGDATRGDIGMVHRHRTGADKGGWRHAMAIVTFVRSRWMRRSLAYSNTTGNMTIDTSARHHLGMIDGVGGE